MTEISAELASYPDLIERYESGKVTLARVEKVAAARARRDRRDAAGKPTPHFTRYNPAIIEAIKTRLMGQPRMILDPMAGTLERLKCLEWKKSGNHLVWGVEFEPEWVNDYPHDRLIQGTALSLPFDDEFFDAIVVSPSYGNRDADRSGEWYDNDDRKTYAAALRRNVSEGSLCVPWGDAYKAGHLRAWIESLRTLRTGGLFILNCKSHTKGDAVVPVTGWHMQTLITLGCELLDATSIPTKGRPSGAHYEKRAEMAEQIIVFVKTPTTNALLGRAKEALDD